MYNIEKLIERSHKFEIALISPSIDLELYDDSQRYLAVASLTMLSVEHSEGLRYLFKTKCHASAFALFRLQYEALVKAFWVMYITADEKIDSIVGDLTKERVIQNKKIFPSIAEMLEALSNSNSPIKNEIMALIELKEQSWDALNSFVHSGLHAVRRNISGYPIELIFRIIQQSNNLLYMSAYLLAIVKGSTIATKAIIKAGNDYNDCLQTAS
ncbi:DUF6988 family protein [Acinetobacter higginsii]|uniref:DUF6988 family protein n=1 Tax=Acinetobacter higginsii TaxID=70347 RepID=UPI001F4BB296|nr:hypothetical protein [Acinetobacter higginsii]MCH7294112.1 hypothetical protein [Acinetobacter higginsii]